MGYRPMDDGNLLVSIAGKFLKKGILFKKWPDGAPLTSRNHDSRTSDESQVFTRPLGLRHKWNHAPTTQTPIRRRC